jgi:hypothetical protein
VKARINALREEFIMRKVCNAEMTLAELLQLGTALGKKQRMLHHPYLSLISQSPS